MRFGTKLLSLVPLLATAMLGGCSRSQHLVYIDTDAPVLGQLLLHPELSADAAIDVVRIDVLDQNGQSYDVCEFIAGEPSDWPLSFGVVPPAGEEHRPSRLRIRAFRRLFAKPDQLPGVARICGKDLRERDLVSVSEPRAEVTIDRVIELAPAVSGLDPVRIQLALGCIGVQPSFLDGTSCIDAARRSLPFTSGIYSAQESGARASAIGTSPLAQERGCDAPVPVLGGAPAVCVAGGFSIQGDLDLLGQYQELLEPAPLRPVWVSPFYMDKTEFTVGRLRAQEQRGTAPVPRPIETNSKLLLDSSFCTWNDNASDRLPINCVFPQNAALLCARDGGLLPSEAQWEHAARGRGQRRTYPWGDQMATCCTASLSRVGMPKPAVECGGMGVEAVGSHPGIGCAGGGDESRDGVLDLGGSLIEYTRDRLRPYVERCGLQSGLSTDPLCEYAGIGARVSRGSYWNAGLGTALTASREVSTISSVSGFRCVYQGVRK